MFERMEFIMLVILFLTSRDTEFDLVTVFGKSDDTVSGQSILAPFFLLSAWRMG
jgi:hypothetical protein